MPSAFLTVSCVGHTQVPLVCPRSQLVLREAVTSTEATRVSAPWFPNAVPLLDAPTKTKCSRALWAGERLDSDVSFGAVLSGLRWRRRPLVQDPKKQAAFIQDEFANRARCFLHDLRIFLA